MSAIPEEWIGQYVDALLQGAMKLPDGKFRDAVALRAEHAMDLVEAWRKRDQRAADTSTVAPEGQP